MTPAVCFAPSPTGLLHVGHARTALINWLFAHRRGGTFLLRLDDTDAEPSTGEFAEAIEWDLRWLGLEWDRMARQSERLQHYHAACERLRDANRLYACYETAEELEDTRQRRLARGEPPIYDRAALRLTEAERGAFESEGRKPHWRFLLEHGDIAWDDLARGSVRFHAENLSDPVLVREDGTYPYMLPSSVDDLEFGVTHVIRGEDHVAGTAVQIQLFRALGADAPDFAHLPLLSDTEGKGLSRRIGSMTLESLREDGIEPMALNTFLARLGSADAMEPRQNLADLAADFDITHLGRATPKFDARQLRILNAKLLHATPYAVVAERLRTMDLEHADATFWEAVRPNLASLGEARDWHAICFEDIPPVIEDVLFVVRARDLLPPEPWDKATWKRWTEAVRAETGHTGTELFLSLRLALTGRPEGPEMEDLMPLIGHAKALDRLGG